MMYLSPKHEIFQLYCSVLGLSERGIRKGPNQPDRASSQGCAGDVNVHSLLSPFKSMTTLILERNWPTQCNVTGVI